MAKKKEPPRGRNVSARLTADDIARLERYAERMASETRMRVGPSIAAAALIRLGLDAAESQVTT